ncbi:hypothetical protein AB1E19_015816 [Capra hircus]
MDAPEALAEQGETYHSGLSGDRLLDRPPPLLPRRLLSAFLSAVTHGPFSPFPTLTNLCCVQLLRTRQIPVTCQLPETCKLPAVLCQMPMPGQMPMTGQMPVTGQMPKTHQLPVIHQLPVVCQFPKTRQLPTVH